ncbi:hypothetical protein [Bradyrhizobium sp.]|uniref:hypothetical protein n=1 Tax=Bradyrhizobium sp. TaxID=376 RepID=UPI002B5BBEE5|nr:hypothetical protein [Bradyrhizobium sp.]HWX60207.1 hypothetical protein [Bradyrhizobium sp.]
MINVEAGVERAAECSIAVLFGDDRRRRDCERDGEGSDQPGEQQAPKGDGPRGAESNIGHRETSKIKPRHNDRFHVIPDFTLP